MFSTVRNRIDTVRCFLSLTGIAYIIDPSVGNCTAQSIDGTGFDAKFVVGSNNMKVRIRTPAEFFYFDKTSYAYEGVVSISISIKHLIRTFNF